MGKYIVHDHNADGIDRRGFLECMAWAGTGLLWTATGGLLTSKNLAAASRHREGAAAPTFSFVQISDSHIGFNKEANTDVWRRSARRSPASMRCRCRPTSSSTPAT